METVIKNKLLDYEITEGPSGALDRVPSAGSRNKPIGTPLRAIHPNSSPVYASQSDTSITAGLQKLSIKDGKQRNISKRLLSARAGGNGNVRTVKDAAELLQSESVKNVVVVAGAGISTPSGIPDFRTPGTGLYDNLQQYNIPYPEAIFDIDYFHVNPRPFFTLAKELYPSGKYRPNYIHYFVRLLNDKGLLLRMYTQNIDGLERLAGLPADKLVEAHGTFATATCTVCRHKMEGEEIKEKIFADKLPRCPNRGCVGIVKPDIVFFGEDLPMRFYRYMKDMLQTDLVLVMGTSLEVQPFAGIIDTVRWTVPRVLFNREAVGPFRYNKRAHDVVAAGDLVDEMVKFATQIGWKEDMVELITKEEGTFSVLNKRPPIAPQVTQPRRNPASNNMVQTRAAFNFFQNDSSSDETSESDSDVTSSDSADDDYKRRVFKGGNYGKTNNKINGRNNGGLGSNARTTSAKVNDPNKRNLHSQRNISSPAGSLTGRSVKSESAINTALSKRRLENKKPPLPRETKGAKPVIKNAFNTNIRNNKTEVNGTSTSDVKEAERDRVLKKYGLSPLPSQKQTGVKHVTAEDNTEVVNDRSTGLEEFGNVKIKPVKSDSALANGYFVEDMVKETEELRNASMNREKDEETNEDTTSAAVLDPDVSEVEKVATSPHQNADNVGVTDSAEQKEEKVVTWHDQDDSTDKILHMIDNLKNKEKVGKQNSETTALGLRKGNKSKDLQQSKRMSEKAAQSFVKYASMQTRGEGVAKFSRREAGKGYRVTLMDKPVSGPNRRIKKSDLKSVNPVPYGYAYRQTSKVKGVGPFRRINVRALNSSIDYKAEDALRSVSADVPKISYRHKLETPRRLDPQILISGRQSVISKSPDKQDTFSEHKF